MSVERPHEDRLGTGGAVGEVLTHTGTGTASWTAASASAPTTADYLVGTAQGGLSAEIVVGATPGGELGGTWAAPTVDATHSGSTHTAATDTHIADTTDAHDASAISVVPAGNIVSTTVQAALEELDGDIAAGGIPATIVDAKGDLIAATAADTVARLAVGANGLFLSADSAETTGLKWIAGGGGITSGTSFPGSPTNGDLFYRSDLDLLCRYRSTGTRWVTVQQYVTTVLAQTVVIPLSASQSFYGPLPNNVYDLWIEDIYSPTQVNTTNNATNYWTFQYQRFPSATNIGASFSTAADGTGSAVGHTVTVGALSGTTDRMIGVTMIKTLSPGVLYNFGATVLYRMVIT